VVNCTFSANTAGVFGGGIYSNGSDPDVYNSILWSNTADVNGPQIALVANNRRTHIGYCDLQGGKPAVYRDNATVVWNGPIMNREPMFVEPNNCNLRLRTTSPCLDASNNNLIGAGILVDRDGNPRRVEVPAAAPLAGFGVGTPPIADLGAYERPSVIYVNVNAVGDANGVSWQNAYVFLQDALAAATPDDEIWVATGEYTPDRFTAFPNLRFHPEQTFRLKNGVVLRGGFDANETDIADKDCDPRTHETVLSGDLFNNDNPLAPFDPTYFENSWNIVTAGPHIEPNAVLDGFSIRGGYANGTSPLTPWNKGGGMHNLGSPTIKCCLFEYNWAYDQGGGMYNEGAPTLTDCEFKDNFTRQDGAGLCNIGGSPTLICCDFNMNSGSKLGGGMYNQDANATLVDCRFSQNGSTHENGGGMASVRSNLRLCDCNFVANLADQDGGAMYNESCQAAKLFQCSFQINEAGDDGGAMYNMNSNDMLLVNSAFVGNLAPAGWGGGIHNESCDSPRLVNCTFTLNEAEEGGGIYNGYSTPLTIDNSILWVDSALDGPEISLEECELFVNNSILEGGEPNIFVWGNVSIHENNLSTADPNIDADGRIVDGNSPARDAGDNSKVPPCVTTDLDGHPRFYGDAVDLGAYEFHNPGYDNSGPPAPSCWSSPTQCHGDHDDTGDVKASDMLALKNAWYKSYPEPDYNPCADFDRDGRIGGADFLILKANWYKSVPADCPPAGNWPP
jgi:predicted outer membrane repeat protein